MYIYACGAFVVTEKNSLGMLQFLRGSDVERQRNAKTRHTISGFI
jgi:hypothetical protein